MSDDLEGLPDDLDAAISEAEDKLSHMEAIVDGSASAQETIQSVTKNLHQEVWELVRKNVQPAFEELASDLDEVETNIDSWDAELDRLEQVDEIEIHIQEVAREISQPGEEAIEGINEAENLLEARLDEIHDRFDEAMEAIEETMDTLEDVVDADASAVLNIIHQYFADELSGQLSEQHSKLLGALAEFYQLGDEGLEAIDAELGDVLDQIDEVVSRLEEIQPVLEQVELILG